jgi:hypothetical protein
VTLRTGWSGRQFPTGAREATSGCPVASSSSSSSTYFPSSSLPFPVP